MFSNRKSGIPVFTFIPRLLSAAVALIALGGALSQAAPITWASPATVAADSDVSTAGTLAYAVHWGGTNATVNGVLFVAPSASTVTTSGTAATNGNIGAYTGLTASYRDILKGNWWNAGGQTATLQNLTIGRAYQVQVWAADIRYSIGQSTLITGGPALFVSSSNSNNVGVEDYGQHVFGVFTADATTQSFSFAGDGLVNAIVLRDITGSGVGPADADASSVASSAAFVPADGISTVTITVTLRNSSLAPVSGKSVMLVSNRDSADTISAPSGPSDGSGVVTFTVASNTSGTADFIATDVTDGDLVITRTAAVTFLGPVDAAISTVTSSAAVAPVDGFTSVQLTVTLRDENSNPRAERNVSLTSRRGSQDSITPISATTDANGVALFSATSTTAGTAVFSAADITGGTIAITQTVSVDFTSLVIGETQFNGGNVPPSPIGPQAGDLLETSVDFVSGDNVGANLRNGSTGTAHENSATNPATMLSSPSVTYYLDLTARPGGYEIWEIRLFSGWQDGRAGQSYRISYSLAGDPETFLGLGIVSAASFSNGSLLTRTYDPNGGEILTGVAALQFTMIQNSLAGTGTDFREIDVVGTPPGTVDMDASLVVAAENYVPADNSSTTTITVTVRDALQVPVAGQTVSLASSRGAADTISEASGTSDASGVVTFSVSSAIPGTSNFSATVAAGNITVTQTASVAFVGPVSAGNSTVATSVAVAPIDGVTPAVLTVIMRDANSSPVAGRTISLASSRGASDTISEISAITNAAGVATFSVTTTTPGMAVFSATDVTEGSLVVANTASVGFIPLLIGAAQFNAGNVLPSPVGPVSDDLLETSVSAITGDNAFANLRNGTTGTAEENNGQNPATSINNPSITYHLDLANTPGGYDITEIRLFSGWIDERAGQSYRISFSRAADPENFLGLGTVSAVSFSNGSLLTRTYDPGGSVILAGVAAIRFTMIDLGLAGTGTDFREFDLIGAPPVSADYNAWDNSYGLTAGPGGDDDADGLTNREEYAFGLVPSNGSSVNPIIVPLAPGSGMFSYSRRDPGLTGISYTVWTSTDLDIWTEDTGAQQNPVTPVAGVQAVQVTLSPALIEETKLFVRVVASD